MAQALLIATLLTIGGLVATAAIGFRATAVQAADHILVALATVVLGLFSQSMTMFFFIGTGKELKEKSSGDPEVVRLTRSFKSRVFPAAMWAMAAIMVAFILGGGVATGRTPLWLHRTLAVLAVLAFARAYWVEIHAMNENATLMEKYLRE